MGEVATALWFHDAVYDPQPSDNELNSVAWAARGLAGAGVNSEVLQGVPQLILATVRDSEERGERSSDEALVLAIDLAILSSSSERFRIYEDDVRAEHAWVPYDLYRERR